MPRITFDVDRCNGCGLCVNACPRQLLRIDRSRINRKGYHPAQITSQERCTACACCAIMCPGCVITVER